MSNSTNMVAYVIIGAVIASLAIVVMTSSTGIVGGQIQKQDNREDFREVAAQMRTLCVESLSQNAQGEEESATLAFHTIEEVDISTENREGAGVGGGLSSTLQATEEDGNTLLESIGPCTYTMDGNPTKQGEGAPAWDFNMRVTGSGEISVTAERVGDES